MPGRAKAPGEILAIDAFKTVIDAATVMEGRIIFAESIRIDGKVIGNLQVEPGATGSVAVAPGATVCGDIVAHRVLVAGTVQGNIHSTEIVQLMNGARVTGDISYAAITIAHGAIVNGSLTDCSRKEAPASEMQRNPLRLASEVRDLVPA
jgi:cytoskeletal protein CcmA (bactofilin family)